MLSSLQSWFTPAILFALFNLVVATIFLTSKGPFRGHRRNPSVDNPLPLPRSNSFLDRILSISTLARGRSAEFPLDPATPPAPDPEERRLGRIRSEVCPASAAEEAPAPVMKKSASEILRRPRAERSFDRAVVGEGGEGEVDAKADDFINRFRNQLRLQRLDSILRYKEKS